MPSLNPIAIVGEGVDYLTCTFAPEHSTTRLFMEVARCEREEIQRGSFVQKWGMSGYLGQRCGGLEFGTSYQGCIVRLSGDAAWRNWRRFARIASNVSRIDVQQTVIFDEPPRDTISRIFDELATHWASRKRAPEPKMWTGPSGAETVYSGKRVSDVFLRCYHRGSRKGCEDQLGHVRFEVEFKNARAKNVLLELLRVRHANSAAAATALHEFTTRGCSLSWRGRRPASIRCPKMDGTTSSRLVWLESQVRPTVQLLSELGMRDQVLRALGLDGIPAAPRSCRKTKGRN